MDYIRDKFGNILSKGSHVAYIENGAIERGCVFETIGIDKLSSVEHVRIEPFGRYEHLIVKPADEVMKVILPAT